MAYLARLAALCNVSFNRHVGILSASHCQLLPTQRALMAAGVVERGGTTRVGASFVVSFTKHLSALVAVEG